MKTHSLPPRIFALAAAVGLLVLTPSASAQLIGTAGGYGALGGSTVTNTGNTVILGSIGISPGARKGVTSELTANSASARPAPLKYPSEK